MTPNATMIANQVHYSVQIPRPVEQWSPESYPSVIRYQWALNFSEKGKAVRQRVRRRLLFPDAYGDARGRTESGGAIPSHA